MPYNNLSSPNEPMNLYILKGVLNDYTSGMCVIAAESKVNCEQIFIEEFAPTRSLQAHSEWRKKELQSEFNDAEIKVIQNVDHQAGVVSYVYGGGYA